MPRQDPPSAGQHPPVHLSASAQGPGRRYACRDRVLLDLRGPLAIRSWKVWNQVQFEQKTRSSWEFGKVRVPFTAKAGSGTSDSCGTNFLVSTTERSYCRSWVCLHSKSDAKAHPTAFKQSFGFSFVLDFLLLIFYFLFRVTLAHCWTIHVYFEGLVLASWMVRLRGWPGTERAVYKLRLLTSTLTHLLGGRRVVGCLETEGREHKTASLLSGERYHFEAEAIGGGGREGIWMAG